MEAEFITQLFQLGTLGANTGTVVLLYKMHRDIAAVKVEMKGVKAEHWSWIERLRRFAWPATFQHCDIQEHPPHDPT